MGVLINKGKISPEVVLDLNRIQELEQATIRNDELLVGARASWTQIEQLVETRVPQFHRILTLFGAPQIRNVATIGGNLANASPIADALPFLFVCEAQIELLGPAGTRHVDVNDFYLGYKQIDLRQGELIRSVRIPLPQADALLRLYKVSRRRDLDISSFTAAILLDVQDGVIASASIAFGAVGPTVLRARRTEAFITGRTFSEQTMSEAGDVAVDEISPITDVRGDRDFRLQLTRNVLLKFFHDARAA